MQLGNAIRQVGLEEDRGLRAFFQKEKGLVNVCIAFSCNVRMIRSATRLYDHSSHSGIRTSGVLGEYMAVRVFMGYKLQRLFERKLTSKQR